MADILNVLGVLGGNATQSEGRGGRAQGRDGRQDRSDSNGKSWDKSRGSKKSCGKKH